MSKSETLTGVGDVTQAVGAGAALTVVQLSGTYAGATLAIEGSCDGENFFGLAATHLATGKVMSGPITPPDGTPMGWGVPTAGLTAVRVRLLGLASGEAAFALSGDAGPLHHDPKPHAPRPEPVRPTPPRHP